MNYFEWIDRKLRGDQKSGDTSTKIKVTDIVQPPAELVEPKPSEMEVKEHLDASESMIQRFRGLFKR